MPNIDIVVRAVDATREGLKSATANIQETAGKTSRLGGVAKSAGLALGGLALAGGAAAVSLISDLTETANEVDNLSNVSRIGVEDLQAYGLVAAKSGGNIEDIADASRELQLRLTEASELASGPAVDALALLNVPLEELQELDPAAQLELIRDRLSEVEDPARRAFLAEELLGGASERLAETIALSADEFDRQTEAALASGQVLSADAVSGAVDAGAAFGQATGAIKGVVTGLIVALLPAVKIVAQVLTSVVLPVIRILADVLGTILRGAIEYLTPYVERLIDLFSEHVLPTLQRVVDYIRTDVVAFFTDSVVPAFIRVRDRLAAIWQSVSATVEAVWAAIQIVVDTVVRAVRAVIGDEIDGIRDEWEGAWSTIRQVVDTVWAAIRTVVDTAMGAIRSVIEVVWPVIAAVVAGFMGAIQLAIETATGIISRRWEQIWGTIKAVVNTVWSAIHLVVSTAVEAVRTVISVVLSLISGDWEGAWSAITDFFGLTWERIRELFRQALDALSQLWATFAGLLSDGIRAFGDRVGDLWRSIWTSVADFLGGVWDGITRTVKTGVNRVIDFINQLTSAWNSLEFRIPRIEIPSVTVGGGRVLGVDIPEVTVGGGSFGGQTFGVPQIPQIPRLQAGGIVTGRTLALLGEAGPEAVIPLHQARSRAPTTINLVLDGQVLASWMLAEIDRAARQGDISLYPAVGA